MPSLHETLNEDLADLNNKLIALRVVHDNQEDFSADEKVETVFSVFAASVTLAVNACLAAIVTGVPNGNLDQFFEDFKADVLEQLYRNGYLTKPEDTQ